VHTAQHAQHVRVPALFKHAQPWRKCTLVELCQHTFKESGVLGREDPSISPLLGLSSVLCTRAL
jgi:hypothetical protein